MTSAHLLVEAKVLIDEARALDIEPTIQGNFVTWSGKLPVPLLMRSIPLADAIVEVLAAESKRRSL